MKITRSFSKKIQLKQFEPIDVFCAVEKEWNTLEGLTVEELSEKLDEFCRKEVEKTLAIIRPPLKKETGKSSAEKRQNRQEEELLSAGDIDE